MKIEQTTMVDYNEVDTDFRMKLPVLFQRLQCAAIHHSEQVGLGSAAMVAAGAVWILNRMRVDICRMPIYREEITVRTWHKGSIGFRAGRDFLVFSGDEQVAAATSLWLYYDLNRKRIAKIPKHVSEPYTAEAENVLPTGAIDFEVNKTFVPERTITITTREGDYDPNGHVNNTAYLEYLETLIKRSGIGDVNVGQVGIQYLKEIGRDVHTLQAGVAAVKNTVRFRFFDPTAVYAAGFVTVGEPG
ncbi:acyl-ACP thioesterase domain-containing protein [uncultured Desulfosarcina sp.]|uniref:acyl-[acyl-carrier-protein] thioesterase n=1 Tax=uncultured Desulfosarcina sp. TaxID=218289 RepID=UPI0029C72B52|nr:acyl-ACP thioesterase domain-containing protein [uncultured Desulfosarcina sp.]